MASFTVRHVPKPTDVEYNAFAEVWGEACQWQYPGGVQGKELIKELFVAYMRGPVVANAGEVHIAETSEGRVVGLVIWIKPGYMFMDTDVQRDAGWHQLVKKLSPESQDYWLNVFPAKWYAVLDDAYGHEILLQSYRAFYLESLPDLPEAMNIERQLLESGEAKAKSEHVPMLLQVKSEQESKNWEQFGWKLVRVSEIPLLEKFDGIPSFPYYCMIKHTERGA